MKIKFTLLLAMTTVIFGCKTIENDGQTPPSVTRIFQFSATDFDSQSPPLNADKISAYIFHNGTFLRAFRNIEKDGNGNVAIAAPVDSELFILKDMDEPKSYSALAEGQTSLSDFLSFGTADDAAHTAKSAPEFFSGRYTIPADANASEVTTMALVRSVARLDIDATRDDLIKIDRLVVEDANAVTKVFPGHGSGSVSGSGTLSKKSYEQSFTPAIGGVVKDIFRIYESSTPVHVTLYGTYDSKPLVVPMTIPVVERNMIYTLRILNAGATITGTFEISPWGDGGAVDGIPDATQKININQANTQLTDGVTADYQTNVVSVWAAGGEFTLGFVGTAKIELASIDGANAMTTVEFVSSESTSSGVVTKYKVAVDAQQKGRLPYTVTLNLKNVLSANAYDQVSINVAKSPYQVAEATLGGKTWMAFNARSRDLEDQVYQLDGASVKDMYDNNWLSTIGGLFQWGRQKMYTPWEAGPGNAGEQPQDNPWVSATHVPCPEGYRIPTQNELRALLPTGQAVPGSYTYNGESINVELHTATISAVSINGVGGTAKYVTLTSASSGEQLIIPLAGYKGDKSRGKDPGFGARLVLWSAERDGATSGWSWCAAYIESTGQIGKEDSQLRSAKQLQSDGYAYVRCIKE